MVSEAADSGEELPLLAGMGAHAIAVSKATSGPDENRVGAILPCGKSLRNLNRLSDDWRLRFSLPADDALEDLHTAHQIISIHYERRKNAKRVLASCKREQSFVPAALHDFVS